LRARGSVAGARKNRPQKLPASINNPPPFPPLLAFRDETMSLHELFTVPDVETPCSVDALPARSASPALRSGHRGHNKSLIDNNDMFVSQSPPAATQHSDVAVTIGIVGSAVQSLRGAVVRLTQDAAADHAPPTFDDKSVSDLPQLISTFSDLLAPTDPGLSLPDDSLLVDWLRSLIETYQMARDGVQKLQRSHGSDSSSVGQLRGIRNQTRELADTVLDCIYHAGGPEASKSPLLLRLGPACKTIVANADIGLAKHLLRRRGVCVPVSNFRKSLWRALHAGATQLADVFYYHGLCPYRAGTVDEDKDRSQARLAMSAALERGDLHTMDWIYGHCGLQGESHQALSRRRAIVDMAVAGRSDRPNILISLCSHVYKMGLTTEAVDSFVYTHGIDGYKRLWDVMPEHMQRLFGPPTARVPYAFPILILGGDIKTIKWLYDDAVLELSDSNVGEALVAHERASVLHWIDQVVFGPQDGWTIQSQFLKPPSAPVPKAPPRKRRRLISTSRSRGRSARLDQSGAQYTISRGRDPSHRAPFSRLSSMQNPKVSDRLNALFEKASFDEDTEQGDGLRQLWCLCWYYSRWLLTRVSSTNLLLDIMEQHVAELEPGKRRHPVDRDALLDFCIPLETAADRHCLLDITWWPRKNTTNF